MIAIRRDTKSTGAEMTVGVRLMGALFLTAAPWVCGCGSATWLRNGLIDPTQVGNFTNPVRLEIREHVSLLEEPLGIQDAEEPAPEDLIPDYTEPKIGPGDIIRISIFELLAPRLSTDLQVQVRASGMETLPTLGYVQVAGFTPRELELHLKKELFDAGILKDAEVQVTVLRSEQQQFSVIGQVRQPGNFPIPRPDFRLQNAFAMFGTFPEQVEKIYIFRNGARMMPPTTAPALEVPTPDSESEPATPITMTDLNPAPRGGQQAQPTTTPAGSEELKILEGAASEGEGEFVLDPATGEWRLVPKTANVPSADGSTPEMPDAAMPGRDNSLEAIEESAALEPRVRILEIPIKALMDGDPRYNVVIRPNDLIHVPLENFGEYYVGGNVNRPGAYQLTGRKITVKQAIVSAGQFGPLAWPSRADLIRRVSGDEEQTIQIDLDAIFACQAPDFYVRPNDMIQVGSSPIATFLAVLRNAFRVSYGFGFVYDRNFADSDSFAAQEQIRQRRRAEAVARGLPF